LLRSILVTGLVNGAIYALLALGFSLVFGVARIVNIAYAGLYMLSAYLVYVLLNVAGLPAPAAVPLAVAATVVLGLLVYRVVIEPVREHESAVLISTIALTLVFQELVLAAFGGNFLGNPVWADGILAVLGVTVTYQQLLSLGVVALALAAIWLVLTRTRLGMAIRATADDREVANLMGMNVRAVELWSAALSAALAGIAGAVVAPLAVIDPLMWQGPLVNILAIVVVGGLGSLKGSLIAAFLIGYVEAATVFLLPSGSFLKGAVALTIMVAVLLVRPEGLFGVAFEEER
jgi:branched-chain amino acid transport system permease protein